MRKLSVVGLAMLVCASCQPLVEDLPDTGPYATEGVISTNPVAVSTKAPPPTPTNEPSQETPAPGPATPTNPPPPPPGGENANCSDAPLPGGGVFMTQVDAAQTQYLKNHLSLFKGPINDPAGAAACFKEPGVNGKNWNDYYAGVVAILNGMGLRAIVDRGGEIAVKSGNAQSEQYHVLTSSGCIHRRPGSYRSTCTPAWF